MGSLRVAIIDGTGDFSDASYATSMAHSFCHQMSTSLGGAAQYQRGPSNDGFGVRSKAKAAAEWLSSAPPGSDLILAGYSRGASAAIYAAEFLKDQKLKVRALFMFDAVARHIFPGGEVIPDNVALSRHAVRTDDPTFVERYEGTIGAGVGNPARPWFGHTGLRYYGHGSHTAQAFVGSHGALGGVGWKAVTEDAQCQQDVASWMTKQFGECQLPVVLQSYPPSS